jgi:hypothetical protein
MKLQTRWAALGVGLALASVGAAQAQRVNTVPVFVNGGRLGSDALLLMNVGRSVLPMRTLFESLGARVEWDPAQRAVYAWNSDGQGVRLEVGAETAQQLRMSGSPAPGNWGRVTGTRSLDAPAMMVDGRVYVPLRFASEALEADVRYSAAEPAVYIKTEGGTTPQEPPVVDRPRPRPGPDRDNPREIARALRVTVEVERPRNNSDDAVRFVMTVENTGNTAITVPFNSGQKYDFEVLQEGKLLWNWAHDRMFTQALTSTSIAAGESLTYNTRWNLRDNNGRMVQPGRYMVRAILTTAFQRPQIMAEQRFEVER